MLGVQQFRVTDSGRRPSEFENRLRHRPAVTVGLNLVGGLVGVCVVGLPQPCTVTPGADMTHVRDHEPWRLLCLVPVISLWV